MDVLRNKQYKSYNYLSRYSNFPYYYHTEDDKYVEGTTSWLRDDTPYTLYHIKENDTYDSIALAFYNNPTYFWVICEFNHIRDPFEKPIPGKVLKIPSVSMIEYE